MYGRGSYFSCSHGSMGPCPLLPTFFPMLPAPLDQYSSQINFFYMCLSPTQILARYPIVDTFRPLYVWETSFWHCFAVVMYLRVSQSAKKITLGGATWEKSKHGTGELSSLKLFMGFLYFVTAIFMLPAPFCLGALRPAPNDFFIAPCSLPSILTLCSQLLTPCSRPLCWNFGDIGVGDFIEALSAKKSWLKNIWHFILVLLYLI